MELNGNECKLMRHSEDGSKSQVHSPRKTWSISDITALPKALTQKEGNTLKKGADVKK